MATLKAQPEAEIKPFDPHKDVSADAKYIVKWLLLWLLVYAPLIALIVWLVIMGLVNAYPKQ